MDFSSALPTFVITLREGVEAALVVGIVLAYLKKAERTQLNPWVGAGVGAGLLASVLVGLLFNALIQGLGASDSPYGPVFEPLLEGTFSVLAIVMLSWMLVWMTQQAKFLKGHVEGAVGTALRQDKRAGWGILGLILFAVLREGFETVLFIAAKFQQGLMPALGAIAGIGVASLIGALLFKWGVKINVRSFFQVMGVFLILIVAGLVITALSRFDNALHIVSQMDRQSASLCFYYERFSKNPSCVLGPMVWDGAKVLPDEKFPGVVLSSLFGYTQKLYLVQAVGYLAFLFTMGTVYFKSVSGKTVNLPAEKLSKLPKSKAMAQSKAEARN
jgi:high-affinity iron transporter